MGTTEGEIAELLVAFMSSRLPDASDVRVGSVERIAIGRSRENWLYDASWRTPAGAVSEQLIVRRDPLGGLLDDGSWSRVRGAEGAADH